MKKLKQIIIIVIIFVTFLFFIGLTFSYSNNLNQFIPENTLIYINLSFKNANIIKELNIIEKISSLNSNFKFLKQIPISQIKSLSLFVVENNNSDLNLGLTLEFKQKDKLKDLVDLNKDSILKLDSNIIGFKTNKNIFNKFRKNGFKSNLFNSLKLFSKNNIGNIYFDFTQFKGRDNYINKYSHLKSSVLKINKNQKEIYFDFKYEFSPYFKEITSLDFNNNFVFGFKEAKDIKNVLTNLKKNFSLEYPSVKEKTLPDGSKFLEKVADPENFKFKKINILNNDFYKIENENINLITGKKGNNLLFSNNENNLEKYIKNFKNNSELFFYIPKFKNSIKGLYLKQNNNLINGVIKL